MADTTDALATALREVRERLGERTFDDRRQVISLLSDKLPDARREIRALGSAIDEGVPAALTGTQREHLGWEMDRQADKLENNTGLNVELARRVIRALAYSLDLAALPSTYPAGPITSPPISRPPESRWLGDSVTPAAPPPPPPPSFPPRPFPGQPFSQPVQPSYVPPRQPAWTAPAPVYGAPPMPRAGSSRVLFWLGIGAGVIVAAFVLLIIIGVIINANENKCDSSKIIGQVLQHANQQFATQHKTYTATGLSGIETLSKAGDTTRCSATMSFSDNDTLHMTYHFTGDDVEIDASGNTNAAATQDDGGAAANGGIKN